MNRHEWLFAFVISGVHGVDHLLKRVFPPLIPIWAAVFGYPLWQLGLLLGAQTFGSALGQAPMGVLSDRYDRRYLLSAGMGVMGFGVLVLASVPSAMPSVAEFTVGGYAFDGQFVAMLGAMLVAGVGSSTVHPTGYPLITSNVSDANKGRVLGMWGSASKFGDGLAPAAVGVMLVVVPWTIILGAFGLLAVAFTVGLFAVLGSFETRPANATSGPADAPAGEAAESPAEGAADSTPSDAADSPSRDTTNSPADGPVDSRATGPAKSPATGADNRVYRYPMIAIFVYFTVQIMAANGVTVFLPEFITSIYGFTVSAFGTSLAPESTASFYYSSLLVVAGVAQLGTGVLADRYDYRKLIIGYLLVATVALSVLAMVSLTPAGLIVVLVVLGTSLYSLNPARDALVSEISPAEREGRTFGYIWTGALVAASASPPIIGYVGETAGLRTAFGILAVVVLLSAIPIALLLNGRVYAEAPRSPVESD